MAAVTNGQPRSPGKGAGGANKTLATALKDAGCSYASLAHRVNELGRRQGVETNYDKASVTRWLQGQQPRGGTPELIAAVLSERLARPLSPADLGFVPDQQRPVVGRALVYGEDVAETLHTLAELGSTDISRRTLLGTVPFVAGALTNPQREWLLWLLENEGTADGDAVRLASVAVAPLGAAGPVEQVHAMIGMFDEMDNHYGGGGVRTSIVHYLSTEIIPMLQQRGLAPGRLRELFAAAARLAAMAGWSSYDAGEYGLAQRYMTQGLRLCAEGRDRVLGGQILAGLSHLATSLGRPDEGVCLARAGLATAKGAGSPLGLMRLYAMSARGHAALGRARETSDALHAAEQQLAASRGSAEESPWVRFLDHHYLEAESAVCFRDLGWAAQAENTAKQSVRAHADRRRRQAISRSVLATAHLQQHRLDEALSTATEALDALSGVHSERSIQALRDFRGRLAPHRGEPMVQEFDRRSRPVLGAAA
uniref:Transcriptional regulator n=1 Tax=Streptomyces sp. NBC_00093 TaxID=2975649 RepID=A0AAU1ZQ99_9ACTN